MKKAFSLLCIVFLSFFAVRPLFASGYFPMHDDTQVARVIVMGNALKDGQFPVRMVSDLGYGLGYPMFNFYGPLPYYIGGSLYALGVDSVTSTKIMFGIGALIAPIALFILLSSVFGSASALAGAILFLFAPYHAVQMYIRGSVGEYWAIAFVPFILYGFFLALKEKKPFVGIVIGGAALAGTVVSHTILGFLTCMAIGFGTVMFWITKLVQKKFSKQDAIVPLSIFGLGLFLSAFFWLPAFFELSATSVSQMVGSAGTTFFDHFVCVSQLWNSPWGFAGSAPGCVDGMSFKFGKFQVLLAAISVIVWFALRNDKRMKGKNVWMGVAVASLICCIVCMLSVSAPFWKIFPYTSFIQYPWRLLAFGMMGIAVCGAYVVSVFRIPIIRIVIATGIIAAAVFVNAKIFVPQYQYMRDSSAFGTFEELRFTKSKISDEYLPPEIIRPRTALEVVKTAISGSDVFAVRSLHETSTTLTAEIESKTAQKIIIQKAWFPGWSVTVDGKQVKPYIEHGLLSLNIEAGISIIEMRFRDTPVRTVANWMSIVGVLMIGVVYIYGKKTNA